MIMKMEVRDVKYDLSAIELRVSEARRKFKNAVIACAIIFLASVGLIIYFYDINDAAVFFAGLVAFNTIIFFTRTLNRFSPAILFSSEIRGINILEEEFALTQRRGFSLGSRYAMYIKRGTHSTGNHRYRIGANVYLRLENGDVQIIKGLRQAHTDLYVEGDTLLKPAGVRYPIIVSRDTDKQPCPYCGYINSKGSTECEHCKLGIFDK